MYITAFKGDILTIPSEYLISPIEQEPAFVEKKIMEAFSLASSLDRFFTAHDKSYAEKYLDGRTIELSEMLANGDLRYINLMLHNLADDVLIGEVEKYKTKFLRGNYLENAEKHTEQNYNHIDGLMNNEPPKKEPPKEHKEEKPSIRLMLKIIVQQEKADTPKDRKPPQRTGPEL